MEDNGVAAGAAPIDPAAEARPAWRVRYTEAHGRRYGLRDVALLDPDAFLCIEGSGGARSYTATVCTFPGTNRDEEHAALIAAAPEMCDAIKEKLAADDAMLAFILNARPSELGEEEWDRQHKSRSERGRAATAALRAALSKAGV